MGIFRVEAEIAKPADEPDFRGVGCLMIDTGSEMSWVRAQHLVDAGVVVRRQQPFQMENGLTLVRDVGYALIRSQGFETIDQVVFAQPNDFQLLGARTLEGFNALVDPISKRLVDAGPIVVAAVA